MDSTIRLAGELTAANQAVAAIEAELPATNELIAAAQAQLTAAQAAEQAAAAEALNANEMVNRQAAAIAQLQQSIDALIASSKLVSTAEPLVAAQSAITSELEARRGQLTAMQSTVDVAKLATAAAVMATAARTQELATHQAAKKSIDDRIAAARAVVANHEAALVTAKTAVNDKWAAVSVDSSRLLETASLQALTPEQLCWSTLRVTGVLDAYIRAEAAELEKQSPLATDADAVTKAVRHQQAVRGAFDKLRGNADVYVSLYRDIFWLLPEVLADAATKLPIWGQNTQVSPSAVISRLRTQ